MRSLAETNAVIDDAKKNIAELRGETDALKRQRIDVDVKVKGGREALAEVLALRAALASLSGSG